MSEPPRALIRRTVAERLSGWRVPPTDGAPGERWTMAGERVYPSRMGPIDSKEMPVALVYAREEDVDLKSYPDSGRDGTNKRALALSVECVVLAREDVDDVLDAFARQVEAALEWLEVPGLETATIRLTKTDIDVAEVTEGNERLKRPVPIGAVRMLFTVIYRAPWRVIQPECAPPAEIYIGTAPYVGAAHADDYDRVR